MEDRKREDEAVRTELEAMKYWENAHWDMYNKEFVRKCVNCFDLRKDLSNKNQLHVVNTLSYGLLGEKWEEVRKYANHMVGVIQNDSVSDEKAFLFDACRAVLYLIAGSQDSTDKIIMMLRSKPQSDELLSGGITKRDDSAELICALYYFVRCTELAKNGDVDNLNNTVKELDSLCQGLTDNYLRWTLIRTSNALLKFAEC